MIDQDAVWRTETVDVAGPPTMVTQKQFGVAQVIGDDANAGLGLCGAGTAQCGAGILGAMLLTMAGMRLMRGRRR